MSFQLNISLISESLQRPCGDKVLPHDQTMGLVLQYQELTSAGDIENANKILTQLIKSYFPLIVRIAKRYTKSPRIDFESLIAAGAGFGVREAALKYDPSYNTQFITVLQISVLSAVQQEFRRQTGFRTDQSFLPEENLSAGVRAKRKIASALSLSFQATQNGDYTMIDTIADEKQAPPSSIVQDGEKQALLAQLKDCLRANLIRKGLYSKNFLERDLNILFLRMGIGTEDGRSQSLRKVGRAVGLTIERIRQIEMNMIEAARKALEGTPYEELLS